MQLPPLPFCNQPWSTIFVRWDGALTRPCTHGPQNLGPIGPEGLAGLWNAPAFQAVRRQVRDGAGLNPACAACAAVPGRTIDHLTPFGSNIGGFSFTKADNYYAALDSHERGEIELEHGPTVLVLDLAARRIPRHGRDLQDRRGAMSLATFGGAVPLLKTALLVIGHEQSEALRNLDFLEIVQTIKAHGCRFSFTTSGQLLTEAVARQLVALAAEQIVFAIDSIDDALYARLHPGGTLARVMDTIERLNRIRAEAGAALPVTGWNVTAARANVAELPAMVRRAATLEVRSMVVTHLAPPAPNRPRAEHERFAAETLLHDAAGREAYREAVTEARDLAAAHGIAFAAAP